MNTSNINNTNVHVIKSVAKTLEALDLLTKTRTPLSLKSISNQLGYPKTTMHTLLQTLCLYNYIEQDDSGNYFLGSNVFKAGCALMDHWGLNEIALPHIKHLSSATKCTAALDCFEQANVFNILHYTSRGADYISPAQGHERPLHASSTGKLMLSFRTDSFVKILFNEIPMNRFTSNTIIDSDKLLKELESIRAKGYSIDDNEFRLNLFAVAAPVYDKEKNVRFAVSAIGRSTAYKDISKLNDVIKNVIDTAENISSNLINSHM